MNSSPIANTESPSSETQPEAGRFSAEDRSFALAAGPALKDEFLEFLELELHQPIMAAEPHPLSEEHRRRLLIAQEGIRAEMEHLRGCESAAEIAATLVQRVEAGSLDQVDEDIRFLGFRPLQDLGRELANRAKAAGIGCESPSPRHQPQSAANLTVGRGEKRERSMTQTREAHQDRLLDEGVEETFPASDPVSVSKVDP